MVELVEVGARDGLQSAERAFPASLRAELIRKVAAAGVTRAEAVSFVREDVIPQMADPEGVIAGAADAPAELCGLVLNERGFARLLASGLPALRFVPVLSDTFSRRNGGLGAEEALALGESVIARARAEGLRAGAVLGTSFGCPFEGEMDPAVVLAAAERMAAAGATEVVFADTIGVAVPRQVTEIVGGAGALGVPLGVHLHNTRNTGYANAFAALEAGATIFDCSVGGLGGCPFAPDASGNIATEDLAWMFEREGVETGVDASAVAGVAVWLEGATGLSLDGAQHRVDSFPAPAVQQA